MEIHPLKMALCVGLGGSLGALGRYYTGVVARKALGGGWPYGTLAVNLLGCLVLGALSGAVAQRGEALSLEVRGVVMTGFLGAFTTFSTFSVESVGLFKGESGLWSGALYVLVSVLGGLALAYLGYRWGAGVQGA